MFALFKRSKWKVKEVMEMSEQIELHNLWGRGKAIIFRGFFSFLFQVKQFLVIRKEKKKEWINKQMYGLIIRKFLAKTKSII